MNLQELKQHAERLTACIANAEAAEAQIKTIKNLEYYQIFGTEQERENDMKQAGDLYDRTIETIKNEIKIGGMLL